MYPGGFDWVPGYESQPFDIDGTSLVFDWAQIGAGSTAVIFVVRCRTGSVLVTPEATHWRDGPALVGPTAPTAWSINAGEARDDAYGVDNVRSYWRLWLSGTATGDWGVARLMR